MQKPLCKHEALSLSRYNPSTKTWTQECLTCRDRITFHEEDMTDCSWIAYVFLAGLLSIVVYAASVLPAP